MQIELLNALKNCLSNQTTAKACSEVAGEAILSAARNTTPLAAGLYTVGALAVGGALVFGFCCGKKPKQTSQKSKMERDELPPPPSSNGAANPSGEAPASQSLGSDLGDGSSEPPKSGATAMSAAAEPSASGEEARAESPNRRGKSPGRGSRIAP